MADNEKDLTQGETAPVLEEEVKPKSLFQIQKESWYDKVPLNLKQLDIIVAVCWILIGLTIVLIALDAMDIFHLFG